MEEGGRSRAALLVADFHICADTFVRGHAADQIGAKEICDILRKATMLAISPDQLTALQREISLIILSLAEVAGPHAKELLEEVTAFARELRNQSSPTGIRHDAGCTVH